MIFDTNFLIDLEQEVEQMIVGPTKTFLGRRRNSPHLVSVISLGELAAGTNDSREARRFLSRFHIVHLKPQIALTAADIDREMIKIGQRLGENDTWIAGFARYYGVPLVSNDAAFHRVPGLRCLGY